MKYKALIIFIILILSTSFCFSEDRYDVGCFARQTVLADVNNDGFIDMLQPHAYEAFVSVLLNNGDGTFSEQVKYETYKDNNNITPADINNDGWIDMVVSYGNKLCVSVYLNKGDGSFTDQISYDASSSIVPAIVEDIDNDKWKDIVLCIANGDTAMLILMNNGDGTFAEPIEYTREVLCFQYNIIVGDVDNNGFVDFILTYSENFKVNRYIEIYKNEGDGTFGTPDVYNPVSTKISISLADVNNDGYEDLLGRHYNDAKVSVYLNKQDGTFDDPISYQTGTKPFPVTAADVNNDEWIDLLISNFESSDVSVLINKGDGTFNPQVLYQVDPKPSQVTVSDFNNDGWTDMAVSSRECFSIKILINDQNGSFQDVGNYGKSNYDWAPLAYDLDKDGLDDIVQCDLGGMSKEGHISIFKNLGDCKFDNSGARIRLDSSYSSFSSESQANLLFDFCSYPDKAIDVDLYFVMIDPEGNIYSGMDWEKVLRPVVRNLSLQPNVKIDEIPILNISVPKASPPIMIPGQYIFAMAMFKTGTSEMIMFLSKVMVYVK